MCDSDSTAKAAEDNSLGFTKQLQDLFTTQFGKQSGILDFLNNKLTGQIKAPTGFSPATLSALKGNAADTTASQFENAKKATAANMTAGSSEVGSGVKAQIEGQLNQGEASTLASNLNNIQLENEQQKQSNYWNAVKGLSGVASEENPNALASGANQGGSVTSDLSRAVSASESSGLMGGLMSGLGAGLGKTLSGGMNSGNGGVSGFFGLS